MISSGLLRQLRAFKLVQGCVFDHMAHKESSLSWDQHLLLSDVAGVGAGKSSSSPGASFVIVSDSIAASLLLD